MENLEKSAVKRNFGWIVLAAAAAGYYTAIFASTSLLVFLAIIVGAISLTLIIVSAAKGTAGNYDSAMLWFGAALPGIAAFLGAAFSLTM